MSNRFLTDEELVNATGSHQKNSQAEILEKNGIYYIRRKDGSIRTTWYHINHPLRLNAYHREVPNYGMNFDAVEN